MADRENIIKGLEHCDLGVYDTCYEKECPYYQIHDTDGLSCIYELKYDILALLKEQEAVVPYQHDAVWLCGNCEKEVVGWDDDIDGKENRYPFCRKCGKAVKWDG